MPLHDALDAYLFSDIVLLEPEPSRCWIAVQGPPPTPSSTPCSDP